MKPLNVLEAEGLISHEFFIVLTVSWFCCGVVLVVLLSCISVKTINKQILEGKAVAVFTSLTQIQTRFRVKPGPGGSSAAITDTSLFFIKISLQHNMENISKQTFDLSPAPDRNVDSKL